MTNPPYINLDDFITGFCWWKDTFFQQKIIPSSNEKMEKKMQNLGETFLLFMTFSIMLSVTALEQRRPKRGDAYYSEFPCPRPSITLRKAQAKVYFIFYLPVILRKRKKKKRGNEFQKTTKQLLHFKKQNAQRSELFIFFSFFEMPHHFWRIDSTS
jgi:hypothetical protein